MEVQGWVGGGEDGRGPLGMLTWTQVWLAGASLPRRILVQVLAGDRVSRFLQICTYLYWYDQGHVVICSLGITASRYLLWVSTFILYVDDEAEVRLEYCPWPNQAASQEIIPSLGGTANSWPTRDTEAQPLTPLGSSLNGRPLLPQTSPGIGWGLYCHCNLLPCQSCFLSSLSFCSWEYSWVGHLHKFPSQPLV